MEGRFEAWKIVLLFAVSFGNDVLSEGSGEESNGLLPACVFGDRNVDYILYNRDFPYGEVVDLDSKTIPVRKNVSTVFITHGFVSEANASHYLELTNVLNDKYDLNIFSVDWKDGACTEGGMSLTQVLGYPSAVRNTRIVGEKMANFIARLISDYGMQLNDIDLIGHSLGAHVIAFASKALQTQGTGKIHHLTALDPAGPGFEDNPCDKRVCESDADFVQVFHTSLAFGIHKAVGNIDFYFNGGSNQPLCPVLLERFTCSHSSAVSYLIDIYKNPDCKFVGKQWERSTYFAPKLDCSESTCSIPGPLAATLPARGTFYVDTTDVPSFCTESV